MAKTPSAFKRARRRLQHVDPGALNDAKGRRRAERVAFWLDVGFLRVKWHNDDEIAPGVFRSNNPDRARLEAHAANGILTLINLRNDVQSAAFALTKADSEALELRFVSHPMAPRRAPAREELLQLIDLFSTAQKPLLFHCKSGADRTGVAGVLWLMTQENIPFDIAKRQLSADYLHLRHSHTGVLDAVFDLFAASGASDIRTWIETSYHPDAATALAKEQASRIGGWRKFRRNLRDIRQHVLYREARWHKSFEDPIETQADARRARRFQTWVDHGVLRKLWHNFAEIAPGVYRANHPDARRLARYKNRGIKTIVNLRGASEMPTYHLEKAACDTLGLNLVDLPMFASIAPTRQTLEALFAVFDTAPKPFLLHCKSGADRTGLAAALYLLDQGAPPETAAKQLSLRFIHLKRSRKGILDAVVQAYARANKERPQTLRDWVRFEYDRDDIAKTFAASRAD